MKKRAAARYFGINRGTVDKMLEFPAPPEHGRKGRTYSRKLTGFTAIIDQILADDRKVHNKQRHTSKRIFERLRDEHGFTGGRTIVRDYVAGARVRSKEVFIPLSHRPGHAQVDPRFREGMLWRSRCVHRRQEGPVPLFLYGSAAFGRLLRQGLSS